MEDLTHVLSNLTPEVIRLLEHLGPDRRTWVQDRSEQILPPPPSLMSSRRLRPEVAAELVAAYEAGASTTELRENFNVGQSTVLRLLRLHGVETRFKGLSDQETTEVRRLYESGLPLAEVSKRVGRAQSSVRKALIRAGVVMRPKGGSYR